MSGFSLGLVITAILGCSLIGGVFFAFSSFVMSALARLAPSEGIAAMQSINVVVLNPSFLGTFLGTGVAATLIAGVAIKSWGESFSPWLMTGALCYVIGTFLVTVLGNVPLNEELAAVSATDPASVPLWERYLDRWTRLNTVRTFGALAAVLSFIVALLG